MKVVWRNFQSSDNNIAQNIMLNFSYKILCSVTGTTNDWCWIKHSTATVRPSRIISIIVTLISAKMIQSLDMITHDNDMIDMSILKCSREMLVWLRQPESLGQNLVLFAKFVSRLNQTVYSRNKTNMFGSQAISGRSEIFKYMDRMTLW